MAKHTVLICDDNQAVHNSLTCYLEPEGFSILSAYNGETALAYIENNAVDAVILDVMLPEMDGYEVCREIRRHSTVPIIMVSAKGEETDRLIGLEVGADIYLPKPFSPREVLILVKKAMKRQSLCQQLKKYVLAELTVYPESYEAFVKGKKVDLTAKEFEVLALLAANAGKVLSRERILSTAWSYEYLLDTRLVDGIIKRLRQKLPKEGVHFSIRSIYGTGYKLVEETL